jgi:hypothetical protein
VVVRGWQCADRFPSEILMKSASLTGQQVRSVVLSANPGGVSLEILRSLAKVFPSREEVSPPFFFLSPLRRLRLGVYMFMFLVKLSLSLSATRYR